MSDTFLISSEDFSLLKGRECWPLECMEAHGASGEVQYIGSRILNDNHVYDYYIDKSGHYWYRTRMRLPNGQIVSMEMYLFGRENVRKRR